MRKVIPLGSHDLFLGEVVAFHIKDWAKNCKGELDVAKIKPLVYCTVARQYSGLGPRLACIGFMRHKPESEVEVGSFARFWKKILSKIT